MTREYGPSPTGNQFSSESCEDARSRLPQAVGAAVRWGRCGSRTSGASLTDRSSTRCGPRKPIQPVRSRGLEEAHYRHSGGARHHNYAGEAGRDGGPHHGGALNRGRRQTLRTSDALTKVSWRLTNLPHPPASRHPIREHITLHGRVAAHQGVRPVGVPVADRLQDQPMIFLICLCSSLAA